MMVSERLQQGRWMGYTKDHVLHGEGYEGGGGEDYTKGKKRNRNEKIQKVGN